MASIALAASNATMGRPSSARCLPAPHPRSMRIAPSATRAPSARASSGTRTGRRSLHSAARFSYTATVSRSTGRIIPHVLGTLEIVPDVAQRFAALVAEEKPSSIALSGGNTARHCYELLATANVEWSGVEVFFGDERWVPVDDPDSNEGMARLAFLDQVMPHGIHSLCRAGDTPLIAAEAYDTLLRAAPPLDLVHLGLGPDGHTASLFPDSPALDDVERLVVTNGDDLHPHQRLTLTFPGIARSRLVVFTVSGAEKREAFARVRAGDATAPAARVRAERVIWIADADAADDA
ncbi:MAG: 6-phosphogluconolactonase [Acidimicrobiia bacterium]|nr:6-phosphogluconolactonase [Acidimicrobiia bacterium]